MLKNKKRVTFVLLNLLLFAFGFILFFQFEQKIFGLQIVTSQGTLLIGKDKISKNHSAWFSKQIGSFDSLAKPNFFEIKSFKDSEDSKNWEIKWKWQKLIRKTSQNNSESILNFEPTRKEKEFSVDVLSQLCSRDNGPNCHWDIEHQIALEGLHRKYICVSELKNSFQGGAHPISLKSLKTIDLNGKQIRFSNFISDEKERKQIFKKLYENIEFSDQDFYWAEDPENKRGNQYLDLESVEDSLHTLLDSKGYEFNPDSFCPIVKTNGLFLFFGFSHSKQVNKGSIFSAFVEIDQQDDFPGEIKELFEEYKFLPSQTEKKLVSPDKKWQIVKSSENSLEITQFDKQNKQKTKINLRDSKILGIFWLKKSPSVFSLEENKFQEVEIPDDREIVLNKYDSSNYKYLKEKKENKIEAIIEDL